MQIEIEKIFVNIIKQYLGLPDDYGVDAQGNVIPSVVIKSQNIKLFNTSKMQITISTASSKVYANRREVKTINGVYSESVCMNDQRIMQIDVYSRSNEARERFSEVQMALTSTLAEQAEDKYQFRIGKISNAVNLSGLDGGSEINRYTIRFNVLSWYNKIKPIEYYNSFETEVYNEQGLQAEFNIQEE